MPKRPIKKLAVLATQNCGTVYVNDMQLKVIPFPFARKMTWIAFKVTAYENLIVSTDKTHKSRYEYSEKIQF